MTLQQSQTQSPQTKSPNERAVVALRREYRHLSGQILERTVSNSGGVTINGVRYNSRELNKLIQKLLNHGNKKRGTHTVKVLYTPLDISEVVVICPLDDEFICVPAVVRRIYPGLTLEAFTKKKSFKSQPKMREKMPPKQPKFRNEQQIFDITQPLSADALNKLLTSTHADNHTHRSVMQVPKASIVKGSNASPQSNSRRAKCLSHINQLVQAMHRLINHKR